MATRCHCVFVALSQPLKEVTTSVLRHSSESSICANSARHFLTFSGLFQAL